MSAPVDTRQRVLDAMASGRLPSDAPTKMYAGYGTGRLCAGCSETIDRTEVEYEAEYPRGRGVFRLHLACASEWDAERRRRQQTEAATEDAQLTAEKAERTRERARALSKRSAELRDQADVLAREAEANLDRARQAQRERPG